MADDEFFTDVPTGAIVDDDVPRDGMRRYLLPDVVTGEVKGRTRVTTVAGLMEDGYGIRVWNRRSIIRGMGLRHDLHARAGAADPEDPSYNKLLDSIGDAAAEAAGGSEGSNMGTAQHIVFHRYFSKGESIEALPDCFHADIRAVEAELDRCRVKVVRQFCERVVYCRVFDRGGKIDGIAELEDGTWAVIDWKTEKDPIEYPNGKTVQLAYYTHAEYMMNYDTHQYEAMPPVRQDFALVMHCRPGSGEAQLLTVPVNVGWVGAKIAEDMRAWNRQKIVIAPYIPGGQLSPAVVAQPTVVGPAIQAPPAYTPVAQHVAVTQEDLGGWQPGPMAQAQTAVQGNGQGISAAVGAIVDNALQSGQQIGPDQLAQMNAQAATVVAGKCTTCGYVHTPEQGCPSPEWAATQAFPTATQSSPANGSHPTTAAEAGLPSAPAQLPGQPIVGSGTPFPGADLSGPPIKANVPPDRPPAPKGGSNQGSPAEAMQELIDRPSAGIDPEAFFEEMTEELAQLPKPRLQEMLQTPFVQPALGEKDLKRHRRPLAEKIVEVVKAQRAVRGAQSGPTEQPQQQAEAQQGAAPWGQPPVNNDFVDMTFEGVMRAINKAPSVDRLGVIYQQWTNTYGPASWVGQVLDAANAKLAQLNQYAPAH